MTEERKREEERIEEEKKELALKKRKWIIISASVVLLGILASVVLAAVSNQKTIVRYGVISGIILAIAAWTAIFLYFSIAFPDRFTGRKIRNLLRGKKERLTGPVGKRVRITLQDWPKYVLALMGAALLSAAIFINVDSVPARNKITFFVNTFQDSAKDLEDVLYEARPEGITRVRTHMFSYALLSMREIQEADVFVIHKSDMDTFKENFVPLTAFEDAHPEMEYLLVDGVPAAIKIYDAETDTGSARSFLKYRIPEPDPDTPHEVNPDAVYAENEDYYLFFSNESRHSAGLSEEAPEGDDAAVRMVLYFMDLD